MEKKKRRRPKRKAGADEEESVAPAKMQQVCIVHYDESTSRKLLRIKVTPDLHLTYSKNGGNLGLVLKMKNIACISI